MNIDSALMPQLRRGPSSLKVRKPIEGYLPGVSPFSLVCQLSIGPEALPTPLQWQEIVNEVWKRLGLEQGNFGFPVAPADVPDPETYFCRQYLHLLTELQEQVRLPVFENGSYRPINEHTFKLVIPSTDLAFRPLVAALHAWMKITFGFRDTKLVEQQIYSLQQALYGLRAAVPVGVNTINFIEAAHSLGVPCNRVVATVYRYGWGARSILLDSSISDATSAIGCKLARDKHLTKQVLLASGLPVVAGKVVPTSEMAWEAAEKLGVPVVVKPVDADGGRHVHVFLTTEDEVRTASEMVLSCSKRILVEKYYEGKDYRLQVLNRDVYWVVERIPGGVTGDGRKSVLELLEDLNNHPDRGSKGSGRKLVQIPFDAEAQKLLREQGLMPSEAPAHGRFVRLRRAANVALGGVPMPVLEQAHPDNLELAIRAADALCLNIAGIDLLIPDISTSWLQSGAAICEVNAQPQMSAHLQSYVLNELLVNQGRIPVDIVLGVPGVAALMKSLHHRFGAAEAGVGMVGADGVFLGAQKIQNIIGDCFSAVLSLLVNRQLRRIIIAPWDSSFLARGAPVDRFERLLIIEDPASGTPSLAESTLTLELASMLARLCQPEIHCYAPRRGAFFEAKLRQLSSRFQRFDHYEQVTDTLGSDPSS
jgi:cyanophycin synthetase